MTEATSWILVWMMIMLCLGFMLGWDLGDQVRRRKHAEQQVDELRGQLERTGAEQQSRDLQLRQLHRVVNDTHRLVRGVTKTLEKRPL